jgi:hypothetical protein
MCWAGVVVGLKRGFNKVVQDAVEGGIITHGFELIGVLCSSRVSLKRRAYWARGASQGEGGLTIGLLICLMLVFFVLYNTVYK